MAVEKRPLTRAGVNGPKQQTHYKNSYSGNYSQAQNQILPEDIAGIDLPSIVEASGFKLPSDKFRIGRKVGLWMSR